MIPLMNVQRQYETIKDELNEAVLKVLSSGNYILGDAVEKFEKEFADYCGVKYAIGVGNGTDALVIALKSCGVGDGDEVILPAMSFFASAEAIASVGATPVFVDVTDDTYLIDVNLIEDAITSKTKAIMPVHLYGQCADMDAINNIAKKHGLKVIEDAAQAAGATNKGRRSCSMGDVGCTSFFPTKNLGCAGDGGMILTNDESIYRQCMGLRVHGSGINGSYIQHLREGITFSENDIDFGGNRPKDYNYVIGYNSRLDAIQAAVLSVKLNYLEQWNKKRRCIAKVYDDNIQNDSLKKPFCHIDNEHIYYTYVLLAKDRKVVKDKLAESGISSGVYFPVPLHLQKAFSFLNYKKGDMPNAEYLAEHGLAIPMFPELTDEEIEKIFNTLKK